MSAILEELATSLDAVAAHLVDTEARLGERITGVAPAWRSSAANLAHYVALRQKDVRPLQLRLAEQGLSSLGRSEPNVLAVLAQVMRLVAALRGAPPPAIDRPLAPAMGEGPGLLTAHTDQLFGSPPEGRRVRVMVTMPSEAARRPELIRRLLAGGMDVMRVNTAHDGPDEWRSMVRHLEAARKAAPRACKVQFDLPGPKLRTGEFQPGPRVLHWGVDRDVLGNVAEPARVRFQVPGSEPSAGPTVLMPRPWIDALRVGSTIELVDHRGKARTLEVVQRDEDGALAVGHQGAWVTMETEFRLGEGPLRTAVPVEIAALPGEIHVELGQQVRLVGPGHAGQDATDTELAVVPCTLPEALPALRVGHRVWFDDGKIGGVVESVEDGAAVLRLTDGPPSGARLAPDKGINLPDTHLDIPALGPKDLEALDVAVEVGDLVALSYARSADDVAMLHAELDRRGSPLGVIYKVENREGFENLASVLLAAMRRPPFGVMIARGDLAVECGFARLAELQEEMLCLCEAAHAPVVWATQVLETAARKGFPSRAEVTDAAVGERAECVMLNKGPFIAQALRTLDDILRRMQSHQHKKTPLFRRLESVGL